MRRLVSFALIVLTMNSYGQCPVVTCTRTQPLSNGNTLNGNFTIPGVPVTRICFRGYGNVGPGSTFSPTWGWFYFRDTVTCQKQLIMSGGRKILAKDSTRLYYVQMSGSDTIINQSGYLKIDTLVSSNSTVGQYNIIMLPTANSSINYNGIDYYPGNTIALSTNADSNVLVIACNSVPLALDDIDLQRQGDFLKWEYDEPTYLYFSEDAKQFKQKDGVYYSKVSRYKIDKSGYYKVKAFDKESKVLKVNYVLEEKQNRIIYFYNNQFSRERPVGVPVVGTKVIR